MSGWTVAETAQVRRDRPPPPRQTPTLPRTPPSAEGSQSSPGFAGVHTSSGNGHHVRWSDNSSSGGNSSGRKTTTSKQPSHEEDLVDLDKLLDGLDKLTETLPDLKEEKQVRAAVSSSSSSRKSPLRQTVNINRSNRSPSPPPRPPLPSTVNTGYSSTLPSKQPQQQQLIRQPCVDVVDSGDSCQVLFPSVRKTRQLLQSRDTYSNAGSACGDYSEGGGQERAASAEPFRQPYHTLHNSKPFSYIRTNSGGSMPSSRNLSRASSREALNVTQQAGLQSPGLLRKIMGVRDNEEDEPVQVKGDNNNYKTAAFDSFEPLFPSSSGGFDGLTWLERQQRKLTERRGFETRRFGGHQQHSMLHELKTSLQHQQQDRTNETSDFASSSAPIYSEASSSTRESSPHKQQQQQHQPYVYNVPVRVENGQFSFSSSTPMKQSSLLSRQRSDTSFDRSAASSFSARPFINRRLIYDSESEGETSSNLFQSRSNGLHASNTSIDSSRPITPAFPSAAPATLPRVPQRATNNNGSSLQRAPSPGAGSLYQQGLEYTSSRRGSVSSEPADVSPLHVKLAKDSYKFWYKPNISREDAIAMLKHRSPGTFVVRDSNSFPGAFGLALRVASPPANIKAAASSADPSSELIRHFLIEPTSKGVKLKGYSNEPVFASLSALVYQHTLTQLALPTLLVLPQSDLVSNRRDSVDSRASSSSSSQMQQLLALGAACNVNYLLSVDTDSLTGPAAVKKAVGQLMQQGSSVSPLLVHFKVSGQGITLTDNARKRFFRKHFNTASISHCGLDPEDRRFSKDRLFAFVARKPTSRSHNQCHVFGEHDPEQPARAIVNFVNKVMLSGGGVGVGGGVRADVV